MKWEEYLDLPKINNDLKKMSKMPPIAKSEEITNVFATFEGLAGCDDFPGGERDLKQAEEAFSTIASFLADGATPKISTTDSGELNVDIMSRKRVRPLSKEILSTQPYRTIAQLREGNENSNKKEISR